MKKLVLTLAVMVMACEAWAAEVPSMTETELAAKGFLTEGTAPETCRGRIGVLRFSRPREGGTFAGFAQAVAQHRAWLHGRGDTDVTFAVHRASFGRKGEVGFGSLLTYPNAARYREVGEGRADARDEAYAAFVARYKAQTEGYRTLVLCLEDPDAAGAATEAEPSAAVPQESPATP